MVYGLPPGVVCSMGGLLYLTSKSESDEGESTKWRTNMELNPGHLVQLFLIAICKANVIIQYVDVNDTVCT